MSDGDARTILNVNSDEAFLSAKRKILTRAGHRVHDAKYGEEALRLAAATMPDLVLVGMRLPDISGTEVCRRLKADPATKHIMVLHISAGEIDGSAGTQAHDGGADGYLTEPVRAGELIAVVNALLRPDSRGVENRESAAKLSLETADSRQTERQPHEVEQSEDRLRELRERLQYALDSADMVAWDWNPDTDVMIQSSNACRILGLPEDTALRTGKDYFALMHQDDQPRVVAAIQRALREGQDYREEFRVVLADGSVRWVADRGRVTISDRGKAVRMNGVIRDITELKMRDIAVHESEARFRAMFHQAAVGMCLISPEGHLLQVNQKLCVLLGEEAEDLIHRRLLDLTHPSDRPHNQTSMNRLLLGGAADMSIEQRLIRRDGRSVWVSMYLALLCDAGGRLEHVIGVIQDIDERKRAEEALQYQLNLNKIITDNTPSMLFMMDTEGRATFINPAMEQITGYGRDELIGQIVHEKVHHTKPDGTPYPVEECPLERALPFQNRLIGYEDQFIRKDGTFFPVRCSARPILQDGVLIGTVVDVQDITHQKQTEEALRESEARFRNMADTAPAMLWKTNASGSCVFLSRAWYEFVGQASDTGLDHSRFLPIHPDDRERVQRLIHAATSKREPFSVDYRVRRADGEYRWASDSGRPRVSGAGEFQGYIGSMIDITERKQAEKQLHLLNAGLERRITDRTRDLVHSQNRLRKLASDLSIAEERERRRVAGELHDYLAQLLVATRMKLSQGRQARSATKQSEVFAEVDHMLDQSLTYTRTLVAQLSPPVLHEFGLAAALKWLGDQMPRHGLTVDSRLEAPTLDLTENQAVLLFQSVRELLLNIVKHAATDRAWLELGLRNGQLNLTVKDEGQGFDASALKEASVFKNVFGLFSIRERMESLGGRVEVTSRVGRGTCVKLLMPLMPRSTNPELGMLDEKLPETGGVARRRAHADVACLSDSEAADFNLHDTEFEENATTRVLLVDDHAMVRQGLRSLLENHRDVEVVEEAGDGLQAIALAEKLRPDVVVMDLSLPSVDGVEATRRICAAHPSIVVIGLSVHQSRHVEEAIKAAGAAAFLTKDCAVDQLYEAMSAAMMARST